MATTPKFVRGDTGPQIRVTLSRDSVAENLTGATVYMHLRALGATTLTLTKTCSLTDAENGEVTVAWSEGDLDLDAGVYEAEFEIVKATLRETVYDLIRLEIRDDIA